LLVARDKYEGALARFERAIQIAQQALIANPADSTMKRHLFVGYSRAGMMKYELKQGAEAHADFEKALQIAQERLKTEDGNLQSIYDLADAHYQVSRTLDAEGKHDDAKEHLVASGDMARRAAGIDPNARQTKDILKRFEDALSKM